MFKETEFSFINDFILIKEVISLFIKKLVIILLSKITIKIKVNNKKIIEKEKIFIENENISLDAKEVT